MQKFKRHFIFIYLQKKKKINLYIKSIYINTSLTYFFQKEEQSKIKNNLIIIEIKLNII
jgi:hypothetical protein